MNKILEAILKGVLMGLEIEDDILDLSVFKKRLVSSRSYIDILKERLEETINERMTFTKKDVEWCLQNGIKIAVGGPMLREIVKKAISIMGPKCNLNWIDTSKITSMYAVFANLNFNGDISEWDVSNVTNMGLMFNGSSFNGDISKWNVSNVITMRGMFCTTPFNRDISNWDVGNVTNMSYMFANCNFDGDISNWDVSNATDMSFMFEKSQFTRDISNWDVSNANTHYMFRDATVFNIDKYAAKWGRKFHDAITKQ